MRALPIRFHLSTCVVLMFAAGGLMWLNSMPKLEREKYQVIFSFHEIKTSRGWPWSFQSEKKGSAQLWLRENEINFKKDVEQGRLTLEHRADGTRVYRTSTSWECAISPPAAGTDRWHLQICGRDATYNYKHLAMNLASAIVLLSAVAFACEWAIRRRYASPVPFHPRGGYIPPGVRERSLRQIKAANRVAQQLL